MTKHKGSCYCGAVKYEISSDAKNIVNCHCKVCRSHSGTSLSTYAVFLFEDFEIIEGQDKLTSCKLDLATKYFCSNCGTGVFNLNPKFPGVCIVYIGTLENFDDNKPQINIWRDSKLDWIDDISSIKSFNEGI